MRLTLFTGIIVFALDQLSKYIVVHAMALDVKKTILVFPPWLSFQMAWNEGVNFGLLASSRDLVRWGLIALALGICAWVWIWIRRGTHGAIVRLSAGMLIGGALGNVVDRILYGAVADFLNMSLPGWHNPYAFNVADITIFAGALGLLVFVGKDKTP